MPCKALKEKFKDLQDKICDKRLIFPKNMQVQNVNNCNIFIQSVFEESLSSEKALE